MLAISNMNVFAHKTQILKGVSFTLDRGEMLTLVGASGSGKTTLIRAISGVLKKPYSVFCDYLSVDGTNLSKLSACDRRGHCGVTFGFIPQNPMIVFDPRIPVGNQIIETFCLKKGISRDEALTLASKSLEQSHLQDVKRVLDAYPAELSGGMLQRVTIAICIGMETRYIFADEPTASLDEKSRNGILELLRERLKHSGVLLITHEPELLHSFNKNVIVMQNGCIENRGSLKQIEQTGQSDWVKSFLSALERKREASAWTES